MIVGSGIEGKNGDPIWPCFESSNDLAKFAYYDEFGNFICGIQQVSFEDWFKWCESLGQCTIEEADFLRDTKSAKIKRFSDISARLRVSGCSEAKEAYQSLMAKYYDYVMGDG